jgi:hypothetical protein
MIDGLRRAPTRHFDDVAAVLRLCFTTCPVVWKLKICGQQRVTHPANTGQLWTPQPPAAATKIATHQAHLTDDQGVLRPRCVALLPPGKHNDRERGERVRQRTEGLACPVLNLKFFMPAQSTAR